MDSDMFLQWLCTAEYRIKNEMMLKDQFTQITLDHPHCYSLQLLSSKEMATEIGVLFII